MRIDFQNNPGDILWEGQRSCVSFFVVVKSFLPQRHHNFWQKGRRKRRVLICFRIERQRSKTMRDSVVFVRHNGTQCDGTCLCREKESTGPKRIKVREAGKKEKDSRKPFPNPKRLTANESRQLPMTNGERMKNAAPTK